MTFPDPYAVLPARVGASATTATPAPDGTSYDRLARTPLHRWWRPLVATVVVAALWAAVTVAVGVAGGLTGAITGVHVRGDQLFVDPVLDLAAVLVVLAMGIPATLIAARWVQLRPAGSMVSVTGKVRWRWLAACAGLATAAMVATLGFTTALTAGLTAGDRDPSGGSLDFGWIGWSRFAGPALVVLLLVPLQSAGEEFVFRGWIIQLFGAYLPQPYLGIGVGALLFAAAHGLGTWWGFSDLLIFAVVAGWLAVRTGGLEAGIALHAVNNLVAFLLSAAAGELADTGTAADAPWQILVADAIILPTYALVAVGVARRMGIGAVLTSPPSVGSAQS